MRNMNLVNHHQAKEFGKGQKETSHVQPPPRILSGIHLGQTRPAPPGRTRSQSHFSSFQWLSCVRFFSTPGTTAPQASLSITNSQTLLKLISIELVMPSNHLILCHPLLLPPPIYPSIRVISNESALPIR